MKFAVALYLAGRPTDYQLNMSLSPYTCEWPGFLITFHGGCPDCLHPLLPQWHTTVNEGYKLGEKINDDDACFMCNISPNNMTTRRHEVAPLFCSRVRLLVCVRLLVGVGERTFPPPGYSPRIFRVSPSHFGHADIHLHTAAVNFYTLWNNSLTNVTDLFCLDFVYL